MVQSNVVSDVKMPFGYLDNLLNLLIIDDDLHFSDVLQEIFEPVRLFRLHCASSSADTLNLIKTVKRPHVCILDLGIADVANDEFYILRRYANVCPVIILTGSRSPSKGALCVQLGAKAVIENGAGFSAEKLYDEFVRNCLMSIVYQYYDDSAGDTVNLAVKTLFEKKPATVTKWAEYMRLSDRQLRNLWNIGPAGGAKFILELFHIYYEAFQYYKTLLFEQTKSIQIQEPRSSAYFEAHLSDLYAHLS